MFRFYHQSAHGTGFSVLSFKVIALVKTIYKQHFKVNVNIISKTTTMSF